MLIVQVYLIALSDASNLEQYLAEFETYAHEIGATHMEVTGRAGWERKLKRYGFTHNYTSVIKQLHQRLN